MSLLRVAVLRGGPSELYDISLKSGSEVLSALNKEKYDPLDIVISKNGEWLHEGYVKYPERILSHVDVVFNALHGQYGEDGTVQRILERYSVPYTGSQSFASRIAINKLLTKDVLQGLGVHMPPHMVVTKNARNNLHGVADSISSLFGNEYVIKPTKLGSSLGVMVVHTTVELAGALNQALSEYDEVMVEKRVVGSEASCGVIERFRDNEFYTTPPLEVVLSRDEGHYSFDAKASDNQNIVCPARFSNSINRAIEDAAICVHRALSLSQYSRSDFIVSDGAVYFIEVNTLPQLTKNSLLCHAFVSVGATLNQFVDHLLTDALERRHYQNAML